jgi:hypothetical protein
MVESLIPIMPWVGVVGMIIVGIHYMLVIKNPPGNEVMQAIAAKIYSGAMTFLRREYTIIAIRPPPARLLSPHRPPRMAVYRQPSRSLFRVVR